jgi:hypothetical protein
MTTSKTSSSKAPGKAPGKGVVGILLSCCS